MCYYAFSTLAAQVLYSGIRFELPFVREVLQGSFVSKFAGALVKWNGIQTCFDITLFVILAAREICPRLVVILTISPSFIPASLASFCDISTNG